MVTNNIRKNTTDCPPSLSKNKPKTNHPRHLTHPPTTYTQHKETQPNPTQLEKKTQRSRGTPTQRPPCFLLFPNNPHRDKNTPTLQDHKRSTTKQQTMGRPSRGHPDSGHGRQQTKPLTHSMRIPFHFHNTLQQAGGGVNSQHTSNTAISGEMS